MIELSWEDLINAPKEGGPYLCFVDNTHSIVGALQKRHQKGFYTHVCWYVGDGVIYSQDFLFGVRNIDRYREHYRVKLVSLIDWSVEDRDRLFRIIRHDANSL